MKVTHENIVALLMSHENVTKFSIEDTALRLTSSKYPFYGLMAPGIYLHPLNNAKNTGNERSVKDIPLSTLMCYEDVRLDGTVLIFDNVLAINFGET